MSDDKRYLVIFLLLVAGMGAAELIDEFRKPADEPCYFADECKVPADMPERDHGRTPFGVRTTYSENSSSSGTPVIAGIGELAAGGATVIGHGTVSFRGVLDTIVIRNLASASTMAPST